MEPIPMLDVMSAGDIRDVSSAVTAVAEAGANYHREAELCARLRRKLRAAMLRRGGNSAIWSAK